MKYKFLNKEISGNFTIPSGIINTETSVLEKIAKEIPEVGILTTKSISLIPREGYKEPIIAQYSPYSFINAVGLRNPGVEEFARCLANIKIPSDKFLLASIIGSSEEEFRKVAEKLLSFVDGFELNLSCPHSAGYGQAKGQDKEFVEKAVRVVAALGKPVLVKVSPNLNVKETVKYALIGGVSGFTAINTRGPEEFYCENKQLILSNRVGGVSGREILELGLDCVRKIREMTDLPIIGCGGISTKEEIEKYKVAGANIFGIGSALAGMATEELKKYFHELALDAEKGTDKAVGFLKGKLKTNYLEYVVKKNEKLADDLFLLRLDGSLRVESGQFVFIWLPGKGEKPFSVFDDAPLSFLIQKRGCLTKEIVKLKEGAIIYLRGPYGNTPKTDGKVLLVGGGSGIAGLYLFAKRNKKTIAVLGAKDKKHLPYLEKFRSRSQELYLITEKGDTGDKGLITDKLEEIIIKEKPNFCINCGPEAMIKKVVQKESRHIQQQNIYSSIEFLTRCGIGLCGSCATSSGYRGCVDGTFLNNDQI